MTLDIPIASPPDVLDETKLYGRFHEPEVIANLQKQQDAFDGKLGASLKDDYQMLESIRSAPAEIS